MNLNKWAVKTAEAVERICRGKNAPCVGFSLVFFDPIAPDGERWNYVIELAFDPHNPPSEVEKNQLKQLFEFINEGVKRIMGGEAQDNIENYKLEASFH